MALTKEEDIATEQASENTVDTPTASENIREKSNQKLLIELVQENQHLWDVTHVDYGNDQKADETWKVISDKMGASDPEEPKKTWTTLCNFYLKTKQQQQLKEKQKQKQNNKILQMKQQTKKMNKEQQKVVTKKDASTSTRSYLSPSLNKSCSFDTSTPSLYKQELQQHVNVKEEASEYSFVDLKPIVTSPSNSSSSSISCKPYPTLSPRNASSCKYEKQRPSVTARRNSQSKEVDDESVFGDQVASTLRRMPFYYRSFLKFQITKAIYDTEQTLLGDTAMFMNYPAVDNASISSSTTGQNNNNIPPHHFNQNTTNNCYKNNNFQTNFM